MNEWQVNTGVRPIGGCVDIIFDDGNNCFETDPEEWTWSKDCHRRNIVKWRYTEAKSTTSISELRGKLSASIDASKASGTNPKQAFGQSKLPMHLWPELATAYGCIALANGAGKYGTANFKATPVLMSIYLDGLKRHTASFIEGEEYDPVDGQPHLSGMLANIAIIIEARAAGTLVDDRPIGEGYLKERDKLTEVYQSIVKQNEGKNPHHYTVNTKEI